MKLQQLLISLNLKKLLLFVQSTLLIKCSVVEGLFFTFITPFVLLLMVPFNNFNTHLGICSLTLVFRCLNVFTIQVFPQKQSKLEITKILSS